ncbi:TPM domain-containing protein [Psittacicella hinzii]|uniref:TPM domain-containing protein n=1 Tax=Psittacicella hinzii TaxID=2028575 RepID=UPI001CA7913F|nr:TPM domain-containing protein [Psittacicella hinzii]
MFSAKAVANYPQIPANLTPVNDYTNTLNATQLDNLNKQLIAFNQKDKFRIVVVIVNTTGNEPIQNYSFNLMNQWKIGNKDKQNGVLLLIAKSDRKYFIATGPGVEGDLPDALLSRIGRLRLQANFREEKYYLGIEQTISDLMQIADNNIPDALTKSTEEEEDWFDKIFPLIFFIIWFSFLAIFLFGMFGSKLNKLSKKLEQNGKSNKLTSNLSKVITFLALIANVLAKNQRNSSFGSNRNGDSKDSGFGGRNSRGGSDFGGGGSRGGGAGGGW